jgi:hypothetical protein
LRSSALSVRLPETDAIAIANKARLAALVPDIPERLFVARLIMVDTPGDQSAHFVIGEKSCRELHR